MRSLLTAVVLFLGTGCIIEAPTKEGKVASPQRQPPRPVEFKNGANFGDSIELTSAILSDAQGTPGEAMKVMLNLKVTKEMTADYMIFVHVEDVDGRIDRLNVDHAPMRGANPTSKWKAGDMMRDEFEIPIPPAMPVRGLNVLLGFWDPKTDARLPIKNPDQVRNDGNNRLLVASFPLLQPQ